MAEVEAHKRPLSEADAARIWAAIGEKMVDYDERPGWVIENRYGGDTNWYLRTMAEWHGVAIDGKSTPPRNVPRPASYASTFSPTT